MSEKVYENVNCSRCGGSGIYRWMTYAGEARGICFKCEGAGTERRRVYTPEQIAAREARAAKKAQAEGERIRAEHALEAEASAERAQARAVANASFQFLDANVGDAVQFSGKVAYTKVVESQYGSSLLVVVRVDYAHEVKMFTSASWAWEVERGDAVSLKASVKELSEYEGKKATVVTRPKAI